MIIIAQQYALAAVYGAMLCSGVFGLLIAKPFSMLVRFFPPLVAGTVICVIGLSLIGADVSLIAGDNPAAKDYGQVSHIALAGLVMLLIVVITRVSAGSSARSRCCVHRDRDAGRWPITRVLSRCARARSR